MTTIVQLNFKPRFIPAVMEGIKRQTIRREDKGAVIGCKLHLYYADGRYKTEICKNVMRVTLSELGVSIPNGKVLDLEAFAKKSGFLNYVEMWAYFGFKSSWGKFEGYLIEW